MNRFNNVIFGQKTFIINDEKKILIMTRKNEVVYEDIWDIPGGKLEDNNSLYESIKREVKEETGLTLTKIISVISTSKFVGIVEDKPLIFRNIYLSKAEGEIHLSDEHSEFKWISTEELDKFTFIPDKDFQDALKLLPEVLKSIDLDKEYFVI
jgi:8-oxo-dGTP pyrophosphatase MutT (NUDIX family)